MEKNEFIKELSDAFEYNGLGHVINGKKAEKLYCFAQILKETNKQFNLTAITDDEGIILKHFLDCATVTDLLPTNSSIIDVGCGAGFPSLPIAIFRDDVMVTSLDSTAKKINFINETAKKLEITNIKAITSRAEDHAKAKRESYDLAISRAVARLNILSEICVPLVKKGGGFIAMKASKGDEEYNEAKKGLEILGCQIEDHLKVHLEYKLESVDREIFIFKKCKVTPTQYPRNYSQITKKPL